MVRRHHNSEALPTKARPDFYPGSLIVSPTGSMKRRSFEWSSSIFVSESSNLVSETSGSQPVILVFVGAVDETVPLEPSLGLGKVHA